jgi:hypothetical protein
LAASHKESFAGSNETGASPRKSKIAMLPTMIAAYIRDQKTGLRRDSAIGGFPDGGSAPFVVGVLGGSFASLMPVIMSR